jgi:hypothetical protein
VRRAVLHPSQRFAQLASAQRTTADGRQVSSRLAQLADAWLYAGPRDLLTESLPFPGISRDAYWQELQRRHQLMRGASLDAASGDINTNARYYVRPKKGP